MIIVPEYKIIVGGDTDAELLKAKKPTDVVMNVADYPDCYFDDPNRVKFYYWYPLNEVSKWGYTPFFWAKRILDYHTTKQNTILIHCSAGAHRSPTILLAWLMGRHYNDYNINSFMGSHEYLEGYRLDVKDGTIPDDLMKMYSIMDGDSHASLLECLKHMDKATER